MRNPSAKPFMVCILLCVLFKIGHAQSTGYINRPATSLTGKQILDPNGDGYTSASTSGFAGNDVANSEISFRSVPSFSTEPFGDLRRGPNHNYSDFVPDANNVGYYTYYSAGNMLFRFRLGSVMPGSKGYSVLLDTDGRFGATGANADPDFQPATTGTNGNPGYEIEIVLETNKRIAIYNVNGTSSPIFIKEYTNWQDMSQVSVAGTFDNGDPDFFIDFYIPFSDLQAAPFNLTTSTPIRMSATTVMSPQAAIGGPKSDIYGLNDAAYKSTNDQYEAYINAQPFITATGLTTGGFNAICTASPVLNGPISNGATTVSGTWAKSSLSGGAGSATIKIYKNGVYTGNFTTVASGGNWTVTGLTALTTNEVITAKAVANLESECLSSNAVTVTNCNSANRPAQPILGCYTTSKGISGNNLSAGWTVHVDNLTRSTTDNNVTNSNSLFAATTGSSPNLSWLYSGGCSSGSPLTSGSYKVYYTDNVSGCASEPAYVCVAGNGGSALAGTLAPTITAPSNGALTTATNSITGSTDANANVQLYIGGASVQSVTASSGGNFTFSNLNLLTGQSVYVLAELNTGTVSSSKCAAQTTAAVVKCFTTAPIISDNNGQVIIGQPITGTSGEPAGTAIKIYTSPANTLVATALVQSNGTWSTGNAGTTPATYNAVASTAYYATATNNTCGASDPSGTVTSASATTGRCGVITSPVTTSSPSISGSLTGSVSGTTVNLYLDGQLIGATTTSNTAWSINSSSLTYPLYNNGVLTIGVREGTNVEQSCPASAPISCSTGPATPNINPPSSSVKQGQTQTYTINNAVVGAFYGLADAGTGQSLGNGVWATSSNVTLTTNTVSNGSYTVSVKGTSLNGVSVCSSSPGTASLLVTTALPINLLEFSGKKVSEGVALNWLAEESNVLAYEIERSSNAVSFSKIGSKKALSSNQATSYEFIDPAPVFPAYYRLKIIDQDGKYDYSKWILINQSMIASYSIHPNPFQEKIVVQLNLSTSQTVILQLTNANGQVIKSIRTIMQKGDNSYSILSDSFIPGMYFIKVQGDGFSFSEKILKPNY